jgi:hypothetical protein
VVRGWFVVTTLPTTPVTRHVPAALSPPLVTADPAYARGVIETPDDLIPLVDRWVEGWALSRGAARRRDGDAWRVEVAAATRSLERIVAQPTPAELTRLVDETTMPDVWLSVVGPLDDVARTTLAGLDAVTHAERMMTAPVSARPLPLPLPLCC